MRIKIILLIKLWLILLFVAEANCDLLAQSISDTTYHIPDVVIRASRSQHFRNDIKTDVFSKDELLPHSGESLGRFLMNKTALNVKTYGVGGTASSITLRGTSASHVQVNWNGFPINSVTLGSCDFSMVPVSGFDRVSIVYGAPGALYGSGTFGGAINLDNDLKPGKSLGGSAQLAYGSLKSVGGNFSFHAGNNKLAWKISVWGTNSKNEFTYYDYIRQSDRKQSDGDWNDAGVIQQAILKLSSSSTLEAGLWYQVKANNIPSRTGSTSYESQKDSTLKLFAAYKKSGNKWGLQIKTALFNDEQSYLQKASPEAIVNSIESHINALQWYYDAGFRYFIRPYLSVDAGITGSLITANLSAYGEQKKEKGLTAFYGIKYEKSQLSWQAGVRKEWNSNFNSGILPSLGAAWKIVPDKWTIRANISEKFRKPAFNDLYWIPGGNTELKPESGFSVETGSLINILKKENIKISTDLALYWSKIRDMIVWRPSGVFWTAMNYQRVHTSGLDANVIFEMEYGQWEHRSSLMLTLNHSMVKNYIGDEKEIMLYSPRVITSWENRFSTGILDFTIWHHFTADRFYDENSLLDPYQVLDAQTGINIPVGKGIIGTHITVNNLTNTTYELIRLYPMPGRYWSVKMSYTF